jgi:hypothetical protein
MNSKESLDLKKLISNASEDYQDNTDYIRNVKHSDSIRENIVKIVALKKEKSELYNTSPPKFMELAQNTAFFLFKNYTDIFNKVIVDELDMDIMFNTLDVLKQIENGEIDQNEGSVLVGKLLKELYVDSALKRSAKLDAINDSENKIEEKKEGKQISWSKWKKEGYVERRNEIIEKLSNIN